MFLSLVFSFCFLSFSERGEGEGWSPLGRQGTAVARGSAGWDRTWIYIPVKTHRSALRPQDNKDYKQSTNSLQPVPLRNVEE